MSVDRRSLIAGGAAIVAGHSLARAQPAGSQAPEDASRAAQLIAAAAAQIGVTTAYDPAYVHLAFPGGDVPRERGVCTDVVVRAYRDAFGLDLQALVNADMRANFHRYPAKWGLTAPDRSIDHRRVPNLRVFFARRGAELPKPERLEGWQPGDIVALDLVPPNSRESGLAHIGIVSEATSADHARRLVIHNIGRGTQREDALVAYRITGRYRWLPKT